MRYALSLLSVSLLSTLSLAADGNRLAYLDEPLNPYYPHRNFPKLITPQWVGEEGVDCVVTLAIDDMRDPAKYEAFLRPILDRLKKIDGRAPVSIMTCQVKPDDPQLQTWLKEGLSIECHTFDHPCPCLKESNLKTAKETYDKCVDLINQIPNNKPVAFRMPCCDSLNTPSPRFWAEVMNKTTPAGNFLQIDSSVFNIITKEDKELPKEITLLPSGEERFRRYIPFKNFVNTIEDYPYPYVIGRMCWEFPCVVPSDWSAQHVQKPNNPGTVRDLKLALDAVVLKKGVYNLVFHPHGWIRSEQIVELVDHAVTKHGKKVKFLTFKECAERLNKNLLGGIPLQHLSIDERFKGINRMKLIQENQPHYAKLAVEPFLVDADADGYMDVRFDLNLMQLRGRDWLPRENRWKDIPVAENEHFALAEMAISDSRLRTRRFSDLDGDGVDECIFKASGANIEFESGASPFTQATKRTALDLHFPKSIEYPNPNDHDIGFRLIDINGDKKLDCLFSNSERYSLYLFKDMKEGWATKVFDEVRGKETGAAPVIPPFVRADGTNNGAFFHSGALCVINEDTARLPNHVQIITFAEMLAPLPANDKKASGGRKPAGNDAPAKEPAPGKDPPKGKVTGGLTPPARPDADSPPPLSPEKALASFTLRPGMKIELVVSEPLIVDPVAFDWGPDGRLWVVEMRDYPNGIDWHKEGDPVGKPGGRVKVLTDTDGDGKYDDAKVFMDEVPFPTGVKVWRKGILVTAAPDILYAEDTDGNGQADVRKILYHGFGEGNQQHRVNGLRWGLDNWLHVGNGDSGGQIKSELTGEQVNVAGRDLRIRPDEGKLETTSGNTQFGRERNDWGDWFGNNNSNPIFHYVLDDHYLRRNPHSAPPAVTRHIQAAPGVAPVFPTSRTLARFNDLHTANRFTSACSTMIYRDNLLGEDFNGNFFVCEPVHNLVHREPITPDGVSFRAERAADEKESEFLASSDNWFRPSMVRTGPDGAIWISDMYRFVIEHPKWIPPETQKKLALRAGDDKGRIYRVYPAEAPPRKVRWLDKMKPAELVAQLESPNGIIRDMAHQMILWNADKKAGDQLRQLVGQSLVPQARLHALCALDGLGELKEETLLTALGDEQAAIRRHAIRLSEPLLGKSGKVSSAVLKHVQESDQTIRLQMAYSLGEWNEQTGAQALAKIALASQSDPYITAAVLSSVKKENVGEVLTAVLAGNRGEPPPEKLVEKLLGLAAALGDDRIVNRALAKIVTPQGGSFVPWQYYSLAALQDVLDRRGLKLAAILDDGSKPKVQELYKFARATVGVRPMGEEMPEIVALQVGMARVLGRGLDGEGDDLKLLAVLLSPQNPSQLQFAAIGSMSRIKKPEAAAAMLEGWASHTPALRGQILDSLMAREAWAVAMLEAVEKGTVPAAQLDARRRQQLLSNASAKVRMRAEKILAGAVDANRTKLIEQYKPALTANGDNERGKAIFAKRCANCHRLENVGHLVGSDLSAMTNRALDVYLIAILDPNRAVEDRYLDYTALTGDGKTTSGILINETGNSITLAQPEGKQVQILRSELEQLKSTGKSLMPEGVEKDITIEEMGHLLTYLRGSGLPPKQFPGNKPEVVRPFVDGSIRLLALNARIYGPTIVFEEQYRNLGYWSSQEDHAGWNLEVEQAGEYRVTLDYACADAAAGDSYIVSIAGQTVGGKVPGTGNWDTYKGLTAGIVKLEKGPAELLIRSDGAIKSALMDLRGIRLVPVGK
jgi:putative membrane-bound dehydrogenase-like protein